MWYTPVSGIWQTVWLESVPTNYIRNIRLYPTANDVKIAVDSNATHKKITLLDSGEVYEFDESSVVISPKEKKLWSPESPYLYRFKLETENDVVESYFALREVGVNEIDGIPRICLNGKPYLFNGLLDQGYFPDGLFLPATEKGYEDDIMLAKSLGFNTLRKHVKVEPDIFYYLCDKLGIAFFQIGSQFLFEAFQISQRFGICLIQQEINPKPNQQIDILFVGFSDFHSVSSPFYKCGSR